MSKVKKMLILISLIFSSMLLIMIPATFCANNNPYFNFEKKEENGKTTVTISCKEIENETASIVAFKYVEKSLEDLSLQEQYDFFNGDSEEIKSNPLSVGQTSASFTVENKIYTLYVEDSNGNPYICYLDYSPKNAPTLTVEKNNLTASINAKGIDGNIVEIKVGKRSDIYTEVDFTKGGTALSITAGKEVATTYTATEKGVYDIMATDSNGSKRIYTLILSDVYPLSIETERTEEKISINAKSDFYKIVKLNIAKLSEIDTSKKIEDEVKEKGTEISITKGTDVKAEYTCNNKDTYAIYAEDEKGNSYVIKSFFIENNEHINYNVEQDSENKSLYHVKVSSDKNDIVELKIAFSNDDTNFSDFSDLKFTQGKEVTTSFEKTTDTDIYVCIHAKTNSNSDSESKYIFKLEANSKEDDDTQPPVITVKQDENNEKKLNISIEEKDTYLSKVKYAEGSYDKDYFTNNGTELSVAENSKSFNTSITIDKDGTYTVFASDIKGNVAVSRITILNIGTGDNPGGDNPGGDNPGGDNPGGDNPSGDVVFGDIDKNGSITQNDAIIILRHVAATKSQIVEQKHPDWKLADSENSRLDIDKNGTVTQNDAILVLRYVAAKKNQTVAQKHPDWLNLLK